MRNKGSLINIDNSNLSDYPAGRIKNQTGAGDGTPVNEEVYGDLHEMKDKLMRLYGIQYNNLPDNETNGYQLIEALIALASKNDFTIPLTNSGVVLNVALKLGKLVDNETFILKAGVDFDPLMLTIKGSDNVTKSISVLGNFKSNEYVRMISTPASIILIRMVDSFNLDLMINELQYLKAATIPEDIAGVLLTKASTPASALAAFVNRVVGADSVDFLADATRNGLYSKEHFQIVESIGQNKVRNIGSASGIDLNSGAVGTTYPVSGNIVSATKTSSGDQNASVIRVVVQNTMDDTNYYVRHFIQSNSANPLSDCRIGSLLFKPINATTFDIVLAEYLSGNQNLKIHFEVVKI